MFKKLALRLCLFFALFFLLLSLSSYSNDDSIALYNAIEKGIWDNLCGKFGACLAYFFLMHWGFAAYLLLAFVFLSYLSFVFNKERRKRFFLYKFCFFLLPIILPCFVDLADLLLFEGGLGRLIGLPLTAGGAIGAFFVSIRNGLLLKFSTPLLLFIISLLLLGLCLVVFFFHDWRAWVKFLRRKKDSSEENLQNKDEYSRERNESFMGKLEQDLEAEEKLKEETETSLFDEEQDYEEDRIDELTPKEETVENSILAGDEEEPIQESYEYPSLRLLSSLEETEKEADEDLLKKKEVLQETLDSFNIDAYCQGMITGPRVTLFEVVPRKGVRVEKILGLENNLAMELEAKSIRILAPIPGKRSVGIEVPNKKEGSVCFKRLLMSEELRKTSSQMPVILGKDVGGKVMIMDLAKAPHLLVAGATGSGKSVFMNTLILNLIFRFSPDEIKFIMVDPKVVEFAPYESLPHLLSPVITDPKKVPSILRWAVYEMECRYKILAKAGFRNIHSYNTSDRKKAMLEGDEEELPEKLPFIVIIIDELADLMMMAKNEIEVSITRIAQKARAVGIHLVLATQRPSVNIITGVIKANFPTRIAFQVSSYVDSKTILDRKGAEQLLGKGDMLYLGPAGGSLVRVQASFVKDEEINKVVAFCRSQREAKYVNVDSKKEEKSEASYRGFESEEFAEGEDEEERQIQEAIQILKKDKRVSTSHLQRKMRVGYNRASIIMDELENRGIVSSQYGAGKRDILIDLSEEEESGEER